MRFGLALSGGALRGVAHVGVLKALSENGLYPSYISGTSAGSMVAALYACGYSAVEMEKTALTLDKGIYDPDYPGMLRGIMQWILRRDFDWDGFLKGDEVEKLMKRLTKGILIKEVKMPLAITAVDINAGNTVMFVSRKRGLTDTRHVIYKDDVPLYKAVRASTAIPSVFQPVIIDGMRLVDGGVTENVPAGVLRQMGAKVVIGINLGYSGQRRSEVNNILEIGSQAIDIMAYQITRLKTSPCDLMINPDIYDIGMTEFHRVAECIQRGYESIISNLPAIKKMIRS